jgi:hypothetical protein
MTMMLPGRSLLTVPTVAVQAFINKMNDKRKTIPGIFQMYCSQ